MFCLPFREVKYKLAEAKFREIRDDDREDDTDEREVKEKPFKWLKEKSTTSRLKVVRAFEKKYETPPSQ